MQVIVSDLAEQGMSTRAIAPVVGANQATVVRDLGSRDADASPATLAEPTFDPTPSLDTPRSGTLVRDAVCQGRLKASAEPGHLPV